MTLDARKRLAEGAPTSPPSRSIHISLAPRLIACGCVLASAAWAFWPLGRATIDPPSPPSTIHAPTSAPPALDVAAYAAPLWVAPPPAPKVVEVPPPPLPPPIKWQLLAITLEDSGYKAFVYDPESDKLLVLAEGGQSGTRRVALITANAIDVRDHSGVRTLTLREPGGRP